MSPFLDGVRVVGLLAQSRVATRPDSSPDEQSSAVVVSPSPTPSRHHSDSGVPFEAIPITAIVFTFIYLIIKAIMAPFTQRARYARQMPAGNGGGGLTEEEIAVLQKLQRTLVQMESRVEALETILIEQSRTEKKYGSKL